MNWPGDVTWITPAYAHINLDELFSAGILPMVTVGDPGTHGAGIVGTHGIGVNTPSAAAVADATVGFAMELHIPNGRIFTIGTLSMMFAAGVLLVTHFAGSTIRVAGAAPKLH